MSPRASASSKLMPSRQYWIYNDPVYIPRDDSKKVCYNTFVMKIQNPLINFENKWVALTSDRKKVIASDDDLKKLDKKLKKMGKEDIILTFVPPFTYIAPATKS